MEMNSKHIETAVVNMIDCRKHIIVPRVSPMASGLPFRYELDLLVFSPAGYATEIEIKTSMSDLKADFKKRFQHDSSLIKYLYFAIPLDMAYKAEPLITEAHPRAGIIIVEFRPGLPPPFDVGGYYRATYHKRAKPRPAIAWSEKQQMALLKNMHYKYWSLLNHRIK